MKQRSGVYLLVSLLAMALSLSACQKEEGPMEKFGKKMDEAAEDAGDALEDAGDAIEDAADDAKKALEGDG